MYKLWCVVKNEFYRYFTTPLAAVYLIAFLMLNGSFAIYFGNFLERGEASLDVMFAYQPWLYLLFLPGISMRMWSEEFRSKTIVQLLTLPVSLPVLVWGKFLASWLFCLLALCLTFPFWITVNLLGSPDNSIILASYFGSACLAGAMLSISQTMSALSKNQVIALVSAVIANLIFFLSGLEFVLSFFRHFLSDSLIDIIASFSFINHFESMSRGLVTASDIVYFASLIILFNYTTQLIINYKTSGSTIWLKTSSAFSHALAFLSLLFLFLGLNLMASASLSGLQYDFTSGREFSLSPSAAALVKNLSEPVTAKLFYSPVLEKRNPVFRKAFNRTRNILQQFSAAAPDKFQFQIESPAPLNEAEDLAIAAGLSPLTLLDNNEKAFFGLSIINEADRKRTIPFLSPERQNLLEREIAESLYILDNEKTKLGVLSAISIFDNEIGGVATSQWRLTERLKELYDVKALTTPEEIKEQDLLLIIHPQELPAEWEQAIKDFSYGGKGVLLLIDPASEAPRLFSPISDKPQPSQADFFEKIWNFDFSQNAVVADLKNSSYVNSGSGEQTQVSQDIIQFYVVRDGINKEIPGLEKISQILFASAGALRPGTENIRISFIPLLKSSTLSALMSANVARDSMHPDNIISYFKPDNISKTIAAYIESQDITRPFKSVVVADTDFAYDSFWTSVKNISGYEYDIPLTDNADFILNALELLQGKNVLASLRGGNNKRSPFEGLELQNRLQTREYQKKSIELQNKIEQTKTGIQEIWAKKDFEGREIFTPDELAVIGGIRKELNRLRQELLSLKEIKNRHYRQTDSLVKFFNIYAVPGIILAFLILAGISRRKAKSPKPHFSKTLLMLILLGIAVFAGGFWTDYKIKKQYMPDYVNKPLFPELAGKINNVEKIILQSGSKELVFYKQGGIWQLEGEPLRAVYQKRVRSFLSALLEASFFEKKSTKASHLGNFGLAPAASGKASAITVILQDGKNQDIEKFDVGKYDIDIGRGTKAAYIRFPEKFQIWLAKIDLIDLSLSLFEWTYSHAWDLRFGRFENSTGAENANKLALLSRDLLNTKFINAVPTFEGAEKIKSINLKIEGGFEIGINLLKNGEDYYLSYDIPANLPENNLRFFAKYANRAFYQITQKQAELVKNAFQ